MTSNALVKFDETQYPALVPEMRDEIITSMRENIGGGNLRALDLDRVTVPAAGGTFFMVKSLDAPDGQPQKELNGVIVMQSRGRSYWAKGIGDGDAGTPPDCFSNDAITGIGNPGGDCATCPFAQFGSDPKGGKSQACSEKRMIFLLRPGTALPTLLMVPPSSLKPLNTFMMRLASEGIPFYTIEVKVGLEKTRSNDGVDFSRLTFTPAGRITGAAVAQIKEYASVMKTIFGSVQAAAPRLRQVEDDGTPF